MNRELIKEIYERTLFLLSVPKCISCGDALDFDERALCAKCLIDYEEQKRRNCSRCSKKMPECLCSNFYLESHYIRRMAKVYRYMGYKPELPGNLLIYSLKHDNRRDTFAFLAEELSTSLLNSLKIEGNEEQYIVTNVPRRADAIMENGYDHSAELAKRIGKILGVKYKQYLVSKAKRAQKDVRGDERKRNALFDYARCARSESLEGKTVILVDDVVTTGASMGACASLLRGMGARKFIGAAVSIAYKDSYIKPIPTIY